MKFKNPTIHKIIDRINQLAVAITDIQTVVTNIAGKEGPETRETIEKIWEKVQACCEHCEVDSDIGDLWDGSGVFQEGLEPFKCHIEIGDK